MIFFRNKATGKRVVFWKSPNECMAASDEIHDVWFYYREVDWKEDMAKIANSELYEVDNGTR